MVRSALAIGILATGMNASGQERAVLRGHAGAVTAMAITPRGLLASASMDGTVRLWDLIHFREISTLRGHQKAVRSVAFASDARRLASGASDRTIRLWDVSGTPSSRVLGTTIGSVFALAFAPDATSLATSAGDGTIRLWDVATGSQRAVIRPAGSPYAACLVFSNDARTVAWSDGNVVRTWDTDSQRPRSTLAGHTAPVTALRIAPDSSELYSASADNSLRSWDLTSGAPRKTLFAGKAPLRALAMRIDGRLLAVADAGGALTLVDPQIGGASATIAAPADPGALVFSPSGKLLISGHPDGTIRVWQLESTYWVTPPQPKAARGMRNWTSADGLFQVEAQLIGEHADKILLRRADGREISVSRTRLCQRDLDYLRGLGTLEQEGADQAVKRMGGLARESNDKTVAVDLSGKHLPDAALARLEGLPHLESLNLSGTGITDKALVHVAKLVRLKKLDLSSTNITDAAAGELKSLVNLESLNVTATFITDAGYADLKRSLPRLRSLSCGAVQWRIGAASYNGNLLLDMPRVRVMFEGIPGGSRSGSCQLQVAGVGQSSGTWKVDKVSMALSFAKGVGRIDLRGAGRTHTLEIERRGTRLIVDGRRGFELDAEKKTVAVRLSGARLERD
jgi:WD40 repeat protein